MQFLIFVLSYFFFPSFYHFLCVYSQKYISLKSWTYQKAAPSSTDFFELPKVVFALDKGLESSWCVLFCTMQWYNRQNEMKNHSLYRVHSCVVSDSALRIFISFTHLCVLPFNSYYWSLLKWKLGVRECDITEGRGAIFMPRMSITWGGPVLMETGCHSSANSIRGRYNKHTLPEEDEAEKSSVLGESEKVVTEGNFRY